MKATQSRRITFAAAILLASAGAAVAVTDSADFTVNVPVVLTVTGPADQTITHDATDTDQAFTATDWTVECNNATGATVSFAVSDVFVHTTATSYKRDAKLDLSISSSDGPASWGVTTATDQTNFGAADLAASVGAASTGAGNAVFSLGVTMIETDYSTLAAGDYTTTVTATLTAN